jgi:hypothetical protein
MTGTGLILGEPSS